MRLRSLESMMSTRVKAAAGGYMDENQIAEETPLALSIGGSVEKERRDYQAYAEGDIVEDESLLAPPGMEDDMLWLQKLIWKWKLKMRWKMI